MRRIGKTKKWFMNVKCDCGAYHCGFWGNLHVGTGRPAQGGFSETSYYNGIGMVRHTFYGCYTPARIQRRAA